MTAKRATGHPDLSPGDSGGVALQMIPSLSVVAGTLVPDGRDDDAHRGTEEFHTVHTL
ncbi:hypothetical protein D7316_02284 [Gordonia insulae]|uniref:Uncharacterized protein n=1 Tax=Gordonia insulae TaxID=2420509 RepID=A0A3G8JKT1_9ACTN|nr:hypothetical protein D7316_02284 [Gordonia insulae]